MNPLSLVIAAFGFVATASADVPWFPRHHRPYIPSPLQQASVSYYTGPNGSENGTLTEFISVSIPANFPGLKLGDIVFLPAFAGKTLPNGKKSDGCFLVDATCKTEVCKQNKN